MFLSSPRGDSIFSNENCCSPSAPRSFANPGVQFCDGVVKEFPFLDKGIYLLHPFVGYSLYLFISALQSGYFVISLLVCGHFVGSSCSVCEDLKVLKAGLVEVID